MSDAGWWLGRDDIFYNYRGDRVGYWSLDERGGEKAWDESGNSNTGLLVGGVTWSGGWFEGGVSFTDSDGAVEIPTDPLDPRCGTVCMLAYPTGFFRGRHFLFGHVTRPWSNRIQLFTDEYGQLALSIGDIPYLEEGIYRLEPGVWYHLGLVWEDGHFEVYLDGELMADGTYPKLSKLAAIADIGNSGDWINRDDAFEGVIDDVQIFNKPLAQAQLEVMADGDSMAFAPIGDMFMTAGSALSFRVRTWSPDVEVFIGEHDLPGEPPTLVDNVFNWTAGYNDAGVYRVAFEAYRAGVVDSETIDVTVRSSSG
jgi:hypothetical protein